MKLFKVYIHTFPNNKVYVGITSSNENIRWRKNGTGYKKQHVYKAIKKYGWENVKHEILYKNLTKEEAEQKEIELIKNINQIIKSMDIISKVEDIQTV